MQQTPGPHFFSLSRVSMPDPHISFAAAAAEDAVDSVSRVSSYSTSVVIIPDDPTTDEWTDDYERKEDCDDAPLVQTDLFSYSGDADVDVVKGITCYYNCVLRCKAKDDNNEHIKPGMLVRLIIQYQEKQELVFFFSTARGALTASMSTLQPVA